MEICIKIQSLDLIMYITKFIPRPIHPCAKLIKEEVKLQNDTRGENELPIENFDNCPYFLFLYNTEYTYFYPCSGEQQIFDDKWKIYFEYGYDWGYSEYS